MSLSQPIMNLERTDNIPQESTFVVEMGDGAGTKAVTKETLTKEMGEALKVGNLEELQTEAKSSIVAAINEAAQSGSGGSAVDILDTKVEIEANTEPGKAAGAQAVKEMFGALNDNLKNNHPMLDYTNAIQFNLEEQDKTIETDGIVFTSSMYSSVSTVSNIFINDILIVTVNFVPNTRSQIGPFPVSAGDTILRSGGKSFVENIWAFVPFK